MVNALQRTQVLDPERAVIAFTIEELSVGGAERMLVCMANEFAQLGWQVHVVCLRSRGQFAEDLDQRVVVHVFA